ncbi:MAG: Lipase precursor [Labilithrix sp.]|nr:Lipase precursor [Labilithrix sp.]
MNRLYLSPGMFGFGRLATYDYFAHVDRALTRRFADAGRELEVHVVDVSPTASIRRRAVRLAELVANTASDGEGTIHLLGHSTGGLDARLVASPSVHLPTSSESLAWLPRLRSVTTMSTPHYGTPLASFFATVSGQRMLYGVSALTFIALSLGAPPLAAASALVVAIGRIDRALGVELKILDRTTDALLGVLEPAASKEVRAYLDAIRQDQGAMIQLTPEAMDLFLAGVEDREGVHYQCTVAQAPPPTAGSLARSLGGPWRAVSSALFTTMYGITSRFDERYPCSAAELSPADEATLRRAFGTRPSGRANDGVVPTLSQAWGRVAWAGYGDHLDVLGHYAGSHPQTSLWRSVVGRVTTRTKPEDLAAVAAVVGGVKPVPTADERHMRHVDWLTSYSNFDDDAFSALMDSLAAGMLGAC